MTDMRTQSGNQCDILKTGESPERILNAQMCNICGLAFESLECCLCVLARHASDDAAAGPIPPRTCPPAMKLDAPIPPHNVLVMGEILGHAGTEDEAQTFASAVAGDDEDEDPLFSRAADSSLYRLPRESDDEMELSPFSPLSQVPGSDADKKVGENVVWWRCQACKMDNSVYNDFCAGMCHTARPFAGPLPGFTRALRPSEVSLEDAFDALPSRGNADIAIQNLELISKKCSESYTITLFQCTAVVETIRVHNLQQCINVVEMALHAMQAMTMNAANHQHIVTAGGFDMMYSVMREHSINESLVLVAFRVIRNLCSAGATLLESAIAAIIASLKLLLHRVRLVELGCVVLAEFAMNHLDNPSTIAKLGGVEVALAVIVSHATNDDVILRACWLLQCLADDKGVLIKACIPVVISCMMAVPAHSSQVIECCCGLLLRLSNVSDSQHSVSIQGGVDAVLSAIAQHSEVSFLVSQACGLLANLTRTNKINAVKLDDTESVMLIMSCLRIHIANAEVVHPVCCVLHNMFQRGSSVNTFMTLDSVQDVTAALRAHSHNPKIVGQGFAILYKYARRDRRIERVWRPVVGFAELDVLQAMRNHSNNATIVRWGCAVLHYVSSTIAVLEAVVQTVHKHVNDASVADYGSETLYHMAKYDEGFRHTMVEYGAIPIIISVLCAHPHLIRVVEMGCAVLGLLSRVSESPLNEAIGPLLFSMETHVDSLPVAKQCCFALLRLSRSEFHVHDIADDKNGGIPTLLRAIEKHSTHVGLVGNACKAIWNLINSHPANRVKVKKSGGKKILQEIANKYPEASHPNINGDVKRILKLLPYW